MKKTSFFWMTLLFATLIMAVYAYAVPQLMMNPASSTTRGGTITLSVQVNGTYYNATNLNNITNVSFYYVNGSVMTLIGSNTTNVNNYTLSNWSMSFNTNSLSDSLGAVYNITARLFNESAFRINETSVASIRIDNTVPVLSHDIAANTKFTKTNTLITATVQNTSGNCQFRFGSNIHVGTTSGTTCSYTLSAGNPAEGVYSVTIVADDGLNSTTSVGRDFNVDFSNPSVTGGVGSGAIAEVAVKKKFSDNTFIIVLAVVIFLAIAAGKKK